MQDVKLSKYVIKKINKKLLESLQNYRTFLQYASADLPLGCLCLKKDVEKLLLKNGFLRIYDLLNTDFTKIKGLGKIRIGYLTSRLDEFFAMNR
jgi:hypothetical protein